MTQSILITGIPDLYRCKGPGHRPSRVWRHDGNPNWGTRGEAMHCCLSETDVNIPPQHKAVPLLWKGCIIPSVVDAAARLGEAKDMRWVVEYRAHRNEPEFMAWFATGPDPQIKWVGGDDSEADAIEEAKLWKEAWWDKLRRSLNIEIPKDISQEAYDTIIAKMIEDAHILATELVTVMRTKYPDCSVIEVE